MDRNPRNGQFQPGHKLSQWHGPNAKTWQLIKRYSELAAEDFDEVYRLHIELIRTAQDERVRLAATELFYNRCLGKLTETLAIQGNGDSPLPALNPATLALLLKDLSSVPQGEAPVIEASFEVQSDKNQNENQIISDTP